MKINKVAMISSLAGIIIGSISWIVVLGISLDFFPIAALALIFGLVCLFFSLRIYKLYPERSLSIIGAALAWLLTLNFFVINFFYELIPETIWKNAPEEYAQFFTTGKSQFNLFFINIWLSMFTFAAIVLIMIDIIIMKKKAKNNS
ncbi:MAG: hypothetical protein K9L95_06250 [Candidatus Omnitrophica bacterium]|nr:hypothetical protein [Candidatus Omnitrophota bacterium]MCF7877688.1 hypothetical protein [Candidatus Omnitrophota bacterium]MCF7879047.1 hypothetical protein [Candidatus Omnitrophota bacterium]